MSNYLIHRQHKYIKKIGTRYFYTTEELKAFYDQAKAKVNPGIQTSHETTLGPGYAVDRNGNRKQVSAGEQPKTTPTEHPTGYKLRKNIDEKVAAAKKTASNNLPGHEARRWNKISEQRAKSVDAARARYNEVDDNYDSSNKLETAMARKRKAELINATDDHLESKTKEYNSSNGLKKSKMMREGLMTKNGLYSWENGSGELKKSGNRMTLNSEDDRLIRYNTEDRYTKVDANRAAASAKREADRQKARAESQRKRATGNSTFMGGPDRTSDAYKVKRIEDSKKQGVKIDAFRDDTANKVKQAINEHDKKKRK